MKKVLVGLLILGSFSSFASTTKDLTWSFASYTEILEQNSNSNGRIVVTGFNIVEDLEDVNCLKNIQYIDGKEGAYMTSEHNSQHKTLDIEVMDKSGAIQKSKVVFQAVEDGYTNGEIIISALTLGLADDYTRDEKLHQRAVNYMNEYLSTLEADLPYCSL